MHTIKFPIATGKEKEKILAKGFRAMVQFHNIMVREAKRRLWHLQHDPEYQRLRTEYGQTAKKKDEAEKKRLGKLLNECIKCYDLTEHSLQKYGAFYQKKYPHLISSHQAQEEASRVYQGVCDVLYGDGEELHFKKWKDIHTIASKSWNGLRYYDPYHTEYYKKNTIPRYQNEIEYHGCQFKVKINWNDPYVKESMQHEISYVQIAREMFPSGWRYYVILYLEGDAPVKHRSKEGVAGLDPGVSTEAVVYDDYCELIELAPQCKSYNRKIQVLQNKIDRTKKMHNPQNYNEDGTIKKGKLQWKISKTCWRDKRKLTTLYRKKAAYTKQSHERQINELMKDANTFILEEMNFKALQKRSRQKTEKTDKTVEIEKKDGTKKKVRKNKRKRRFGASIQDRAPSSFVAILKRKCGQAGGAVIEVSTKEFKASQYDHSKDLYIKVPLSQRWKTIENEQGEECRVQRDLYSAFLLKNSNDQRNSPDRAKCIKEFDEFVEHMNVCIEKIKQTNTSYPACFGF